LASVFIALDLPEFDRPTKAISTPVSGGSCSKSCADATYSALSNKPTVSSSASIG
jgi:hypothetical protein